MVSARPPPLFSSPAVAHLLPPGLAQLASRLLRLSESAACPFRPPSAPLVRFGHHLPLVDWWAHPVSEPGVVTFIRQLPSSPAPSPLPSHRAPPSSTPRVPPDRYHLAFIFLHLNPLLNPPPSSMALKPLMPALNSPATPPRRSPAPPRKGQLHSRNIPHLLHASPELLPLFTSFSTRTERR
jgi:hypothetical protein